MLGPGILDGNLDNFVSSFYQVDHTIGNGGLNVLSSEKVVKSWLIFELDTLGLEFFKLSSEEWSEA